ncbi:TrkH family potassium uptake protein [Erysipelothrix urinaevulpis]|uniref:TrkH family potassium uptake protein n=1 Tax=Erysipelothrix urinaevulpis TaxID=2683717 RepID=UPI001359C457|nr:TrkH family potassium uptake protein [Erysipelothrix urinaevulpis]
MTTKYLKNLSIPQQIAFGFFACIFVGAILLSLPISSSSGEFTNFIDALFTATSAICVTGQVTLNTAEHWSYFGKTVIITLIEIGGLGFMSIIVLVFVFMGKRLTLKQRLLVKEAVNTDNLKDAQNIIRYIIKFSLSVQFIGALILSIDFIPRFGFFKGVYFSAFHSISAFCNAGFDLFGNSLEGFTQNPLVMFTIAFLIIFGGLGFIVWRDVLNYKKHRSLLLHTRLTLKTTGFILLISFILLSFSEIRHGTFAELSIPNQLMNTFFMAVTPRTAGYANINYANVSHFGVFITILLMFVGASSGSTGGGVKVTTFATIALYIKAKFNDEDVRYGNRAIAKEKVSKAILIIFIGISMIMIATMLLLLTETIPKGFGIEYILVEVVSCFGTVGLTMGLTPHLSSIGKIILIVMMFAGRIGLLTFFISFSAHPDERRPLISYPEENILVG